MPRKASSDLVDLVPSERRSRDAASDLSSLVAQRLQALLASGGPSVERLSAISGITRRALANIIAGELVPTINVLWRIANALGVPFGSLIASRKRRGMTLLRPDKRQVIATEDSSFTSRSLLPFDGERLVEFYELTIQPGHAQHSEAHAPGTIESLVLVRGRVEITAGREPSQQLEPGDSLIFDGDVPHSYRNTGEAEAVIHLVMSYTDLID